jgi:hypothetical protein
MIPRNLFCVILLSVLLAGCRKEETLITGDITGYVTCISPFYKTYPLEGAAEVDLMKDTVVITTQQTGENGQFTFPDVPYGKFLLRPTKPGYVEAWMREPVYHAGGATPTFSNTTLYEVPAFQLIYDSTVYSADNYSYVMYLHFSDPAMMPGPFSGFSYFAFFSEQPTVDRSTFLESLKINGLTWDTNADGISDIIIGYNFYPGFTFNTFSENLYVRLYPVAVGQGFYPAEVVPGAFGPPSDVFSFKNLWAAR